LKTSKINFSILQLVELHHIKISKTLDLGFFKRLCQDHHFAQIEDFCDFFTVLNKLKTEHHVSKSMIFRLQAQSTDPGTIYIIISDRMSLKMYLSLLKTINKNKTYWAGRFTVVHYSSP
jgi:hypothetical protein